MTPKVATEGSACARPGLRRFHILGAGVSGLRVAHGLLRDGLVVQGDTLLIQDARKHVGGCLAATQANGFLLEHGAQGVLSARESFVKTCEETGLANQAQGNAPTAKRRFLISPPNAGAPRYVPLRPPLWNLVSEKILTAVQWLRALCEPFVRGRKTADPNETLFDFFSRRFGAAFARRMAIPMATGIWAGGARRILVRNAFPRLVEWETRFGSVVGGALRFVLSSRRSLPSPTSSFPKGLVSFPEGMQALPKALAHTIESLAKQRGVAMEWRLERPAASIDSSPQGASVDGEPCDVLVIAFPPFANASERLQWRHAPTHAEWTLLESLPTHGVAVVGVGGWVPLGFPTPEGFGALAPEESSGLLGVLHVHDMFPFHVPARSEAPQGTRPVLFRLLLGGDRDPSLASAPKSTLHARALGECKALKLVPEDFEPAFCDVVQWPKAIAVMGSEHAEKSPACKRIENAFPGVFLSGNYISGVGVADCLAEAELTLARIAEHLRRSAPPLNA